MSDTELLPKSKPGPVQRLEVFTGTGRRRVWTAEQKARIIAESYASGETVSGDWIKRHQLIIGQAGVGKSFIACALGHKACRDNRSVLYHRLPRLFDALPLARGDGRHGRLLRALARVELLILDDWGLSPLTPDQGRDLLEVLDDRHGRSSTIVTSQLPVDHWHELIGNPNIAECPSR